MTSNDDIVVSLESQTIKDLDRNFIGANSSFGNIVRTHLGHSKQVVVKMRTVRSSTDFYNLETLRSFPSGPHSGLLCQTTSTHLAPIAERSSILALHVDRAQLDFAQLRINVLSFIRVVHVMSTKTNARFIPGSQNNSKDDMQTHDVSLQTIQRNCFILPSDILLRDANKAMVAAPNLDQRPRSCH